MQVDTYRQERERMQRVTREEYLARLRRNSSGFTRGVSKYRGVTRYAPLANEHCVSVSSDSRISSCICGEVSGQCVQFDCIVSKHFQ